MEPVVEIHGLVLHAKPKEWVMDGLNIGKKMTGNYGFHAVNALNLPLGDNFCHPFMVFYGYIGDGLWQWICHIKTTVGFCHQDGRMKSVRAELPHFGQIPPPSPKPVPSSQILLAPRFFVKGYRLGVLDENLV